MAKNNGTQQESTHVNPCIEKDHELINTCKEEGPQGACPRISGNIAAVPAKGRRRSRQNILTERITNG